VRWERRWGGEDIVGALYAAARVNVLMLYLLEGLLGRWSLSRPLLLWTRGTRSALVCKGTVKWSWHYRYLPSCTYMRYLMQGSGYMKGCNFQFFVLLPGDRRLGAGTCRDQSVDKASGAV
jgi:hypothetical protein